MQTWFAIKPLRWKDKDGTWHHAERWSDVELLVRLVPRASQKGAIAPLSDARRKDHKGMLGSFIAPEHVVVDLNSGVLPPSDLPPGFERLPVGAERVLSQ